MKYAFALLLAVMQIGTTFARPCPPQPIVPEVASPLVLDDKKELPVLIIPQIEALCLHFDHWALMETDLITVPAELRAQIADTQALAKAELQIVQDSCMDIYLTQFHDWEVSLATLQAEKDRSMRLDRSLRIWRHVALGLGALAVSFGTIAIVQMY